MTEIINPLPGDRYVAYKYAASTSPQADHNRKNYNTRCKTLNN
jgi:hypothetical protein